MFSYEWVKNNEEDFLVLLCQGLLVSFVIAAVALLSGIQAPYGRYAKQGWGVFNRWQSGLDCSRGAKLGCCLLALFSR